jgi:formylglycine-generating enzyme required for sulfatase activity
MLWVFCWLLALWPLVAMGQSPIPNDPFLSVPPPASRPRPVEPAPRPTQPRPATPPQAVTPSGYPVPVGQSFRDCADCPEMMVIPRGSFMMGSPGNERGRFPHEGPQRRVSLNTPLAVGRFEVTFVEWDACHAAGGCRHQPGDGSLGRGSRPVINVSWNDAQEYVRWLSRRTGRDYRLLTEAEWEYAARAGTTTPYFTGTSISAAQANIDGSGFRLTQPVGSYAANRFGLHDMVGNVAEWVEDCYLANYVGASSDSSHVAANGDCSYRVLRGGSWSSPPEHLRSAFRGWFAPGSRSGNDGFRVARTPSG